MSAAARPCDALPLEPTSLASDSHRSRPWWALVTGRPHHISSHTRGATAPSAGRHMLRPRDATDFTVHARSQHGCTSHRHRAEDFAGAIGGPYATENQRRQGLAPSGASTALSQRLHTRRLGELHYGRCCGRVCPTWQTQAGLRRRARGSPSLPPGAKIMCAPWPTC